MTLESTVICVDNSEYCRNGDYAPTRLLAQRDAINMVARYLRIEISWIFMVLRAKLRQNAENTCALLTMANNGLAATLTNDQGKLHSVLSRVEPGGEIKVIFMVSLSGSTYSFSLEPVSESLNYLSNIGWTSTINSESFFLFAPQLMMNKKILSKLRKNWRKKKST